MNSDQTFIILSPGFPANEADSTCLPFPQSFVKTLKKQNPTLNIIVLAFQYPFTNAEYEWHGVRVISFNGRNRGMISRLIIWKAVWKKLKKIIHGNENNILGILNLWLGECALIGKYVSKKYQLKTFTWLLGQDAKISNRYFSRVNPTAGSLIALSDFIAAEFYSNYKITPANIIPPGIDTSDFPTKQAERNIDIMGAGSLISLKQYDIFIKVVAALAGKNPNIKAVICGKGPEQENLQRMINAHGLSGNIELYGEMDHATVLELMQRSKVFLHPSSYEGFGVVILEALYAGAHVISFCKPMNSLFKNHTVVASEDEMISITNDILSNNDLTYEPVTIYSIEDGCRKLLSLYGS